MLKRAKTALAIIGFLALFGFLAFQTGVSSKYPQRQGEQAAAAQDHEHKNILERFWEWTTDDPVAVYTLVLAISTIGLWFVTWIGILRQSREIRILQRAYISAEPGGVSKSESSKECHPNIIIRNAGNLPAGNVRWVIYRETDKNRLRTNLPIDESKVGGLITLTPGAVMIQGGDTIEVGDESHNIRRERGLYLYVWGAIIYEDGFGNPRGTRFCHRYNLINLRDDGEPITMTGGRYAGFWLSGRSIDAEYGRYHRYGNDAD